MHICVPHRLLQIFGFNGVSSTAEGSVIGSEAERKRMLMGGGGGGGREGGGGLAPPPPPPRQEGGLMGPQRETL